MRKIVITAFLAVAINSPLALNAKDKPKDKGAVDSPPALTAPAALTDIGTATLAGTKRVAITSVIVTIQASTSAASGPSDWFKFLQPKHTAETVLAWDSFPDADQKAVANAAYEKLKADLTAAGFEVVPEEEIKKNANYQAILKSAKIPNPTRYANILGDAYYVGPDSLTPYLPYNIEVGQFQTEPKSYIGWSSKMGWKSITPNGPSAMSLQNTWGVPKLEVQLAKDLNAHVVKAQYVLTLGRAAAKRDHMITQTYYEKTTNYSAEGMAYAEPGLLPGQTHISFRTPNGNAKWQKGTLTKVTPPKDGDVSVHLLQPMGGRTDLFTMTSESSRKDKFLSMGGPQFKFLFSAKLNDTKGYTDEVTKMIATANGYMLPLVKPQ